MHTPTMDQHQALIPNLKKFPTCFLNKMEIAKKTWKSLTPPQIERVDFSDFDFFQSDLKDIPVFHYDATQLAQSGVIIMDLFQACLTYPDLIQDNLFSVIDSQADQVTAYNLAFLQGGLFIYVPPYLELDQALDITVLINNQKQAGFNQRILLLADHHSHFTYLERLQSQGQQANKGSLMVEVIANEGAQVNYLALDAIDSAQGQFYLKRYGATQKDAQINWSIAAMNQANTILDLDTYLLGPGSQSYVQIVAIANQDQVQVIDSKVVNQANYSVGHIYQHGVILDQARLSFNGIGHIIKGAKQADAQQESRVLMLSDQGRGDANPILLIDEFEVTAGHAASIGQIDADQLYYLMSRGLKRKEAEYLVIRGFLGSVIHSMPSRQVQDQVIAIMDQKLASLRA